MMVCGTFFYLPCHYQYITLEQQNTVQAEIIVRVATPDDKHYSQEIVDEMYNSAQARGTGIAKRTPEYVAHKMEEGKAIIAHDEHGKWAGFCYIEEWSHGKFVANSGLIVSPSFRKHGVAKKIKHAIFNLSRTRYPDAKIFGLTSGMAVMKINSELGYEPVTYAELTDDDDFWKGCRNCVNYDILMSKNRTNCICTAMLYDPEDHYTPEETMENFEEKKNEYARLLQFKKAWFLKPFIKKDKNKKSAGTSETKHKSLLHDLFH